VAADESLVRVLKACQAPYPISKPSAALAVQAFNLESRQRTHQLVAECIQERERVSKKLTQLSIVQAVYESDANFLLVKFDHAEPLNAFLLERGLVVRAMTQYPALAQCLRISIGTREENNALLLALQQYCELNHA
jgi:histidinol-phosphate aminotransferase